MSRSPILEGISDAVGFVGGALLSFWAGRLLGWDVFASGYGTNSIGGILLVGLGGGLGLQLARKWQAQQGERSDAKDEPSSKKDNE